MLSVYFYATALNSESILVKVQLLPTDTSNCSVGLNSNSFAGVSLKRATITARTPRKKALTYNGDKETTLSTPFAEAPTFPLSADWAGTKRKGGPKKKRSPSNCAAKKEIVSLLPRRHEDRITFTHS